MKILIVTYITFYLTQNVFCRTADDCINDIKKDFSRKRIEYPIAPPESPIWYAQIAFLHMRKLPVINTQASSSQASSSSTDPTDYVVKNCTSEDGRKYYAEINLYITAGQFMKDYGKFCDSVDDCAKVKEYFKEFIFSQENEFYDKYTYNQNMIQWAYSNVVIEDIQENDAAIKYVNHLSYNIALRQRSDTEVQVLQIPDLYCKRKYKSSELENKEENLRERSPEPIIF